jgi:Ankyrin repeats (3 copies)
VNILSGPTLCRRRARPPEHSNTLGWGQLGFGINVIVDSLEQIRNDIFGVLLSSLSILEKISEYASTFHIRDDQSICLCPRVPPLQYLDTAETASHTTPVHLLSAMEPSISSSSSMRKRKADCLGRVAAANSTESSGRGALTGWTTCPLCGRHSKKRYALGRGIASHLQAVHTPWKPGKTEKKKRRRQAERSANKKQRQGEDGQQPLDAQDEVEREAWEPTQKEIEEWDAKVLQIVAELEAKLSQSNVVEDVELVRPGLDRNGRKSHAYRESLPKFLQAAADGNLELLQTMVKEVCKAKGPTGIRELIDTRDRHLSSAEHWAAGGGHLPCLELLRQLRREHGRQLDSTQDTTVTKRTRRRDGKTCLHYAARNGHLKCVQYLVEDQKHLVDEVSGDGTTPFHMACFGGHVNVVNYLIEKGADVLATNEWGCGATHWVGMTRCNSETEVRRLCGLLQSRGACFVTPQKQGHTALHKAAQKLNRHVIEYIAQSSDEGGAGLTAEQRIQVGRPDQGGHTASEIWMSAGGEEDFAKRMNDEWGW